MEFEIAQDASSLKWFYFTDGLMDCAHVFNTEKEAIACAAAAPEMKAALEEAREQIEYMREVIRKTDDWQRESSTNATLHQIDEALAKVEGK